MDKYGRIPHGNKKARAILLNNMKNLDLRDSFRVKHPGERQFSRVQSNPYAVSRLDFF